MLVPGQRQATRRAATRRSGVTPREVEGIDERIGGGVVGDPIGEAAVRVARHGEPTVGEELRGVADRGRVGKLCGSGAECEREPQVAAQISGPQRSRSPGGGSRALRPRRVTRASSSTTGLEWRQRHERERADHGSTHVVREREVAGVGAHQQPHSGGGVCATRSSASERSTPIQRMPATSGTSGALPHARSSSGPCEPSIAFASHWYGVDPPDRHPRAPSR